VKRQFTVTTYIIENQRILLILHRKLKKWLPPGGHLESNEIPPETARREAREETGLEIEIITQENVWIDRWNAKSMERPYLCLIEEIPAYDNQPPHQHIDMVYLARPVGGKEKHNLHETNGMRWFTLEEIEALAPDKEIFVETQQVIRHLIHHQRKIFATTNEIV
jgi:8-oxo-dGTP pyrophosphatase MutT (NUDIX family)